MSTLGGKQINKPADLHQQASVCWLEAEYRMLNKTKRRGDQSRCLMVTDVGSFSLADTRNGSMRISRTRL